MKSTGIVRRLDELGRITLPIELRRNFDVNERDPLEIFVDDDKIILKKYNITYNNLPFNTYFIPLMQIPLYLVIYIPLYKLLGESPFISITLMIIVYIIGQIVSYNILKEKELKVLNTLSVPIIIIIYLGFIYLTYNPPHKFIFFDILNEKYGINEYKKITKYR